jgi:geranylgeranyl diphosphate synthase type II
MNLKQYLANRTRQIEEAMEFYLPVLPPEARQLEQAMHYSLFAGGKRLRPILTLASAEAVNAEASVAMPAACAIEYIHTYSLIHDDLPSMDDDDWRRGQLTNHKMFGEAQAILAGDALLTHAFAVLAATGDHYQASPRAVLQIVLEIANAAGPKGMVGGQSADIEQAGSTHAKTAPKMLRYIHNHKTGSLLKAAIRAGAIVGGANTEQLASLTTYGEKIGLAFQICDDILNATGDPELLGKPVNTDTQHRKLTYVTVHGLKEAHAVAEQLVTEAVLALDSFDQLADPLRAIARFVIERHN